ncbi:MAG TPA: DoxX family protein [Burkholderiales bacterium]|nr:DoxX family protein [Burkholderiales bacterium]
MTNIQTAPYAATVLRLSLGAMYVSHSLILKHFTYTLPGTAQFFESIGLPGALAYLTFWAELIGGLLLIAGIGTRWVSLALIPILVGATWVHAGNGWVFSAPNGGWEYPVFLIVASVVQALLGDGAYALKARIFNARTAATAAAVLIAAGITFVASEVTAQEMLQLCIPPAVAQVIS